jgi:hypothetical protein
MRVTDWTLLGLIGLGAAGVLVATASGLFADPPPNGGATAVPRPAVVEQAVPRLVEPAPVTSTAPARVTAPTPDPARTQAPPQQQGEWRFPQQPEVKLAVPREPQEADIQRPAPVLSPGEQQAAWAARDQLANAARAGNASPPSPLLTRQHEGPAPDKADVER